MGVEDRTGDAESTRTGFEDSVVTSGLIVPDTGNPAMTPRNENDEVVLAQADTHLAPERIVVCTEYVSSLPTSRVEMHV